MAGLLNLHLVLFRLQIFFVFGFIPTFEAIRVDNKKKKRRFGKQFFVNNLFILKFKIKTKFYIVDF